MNKIILLLLSLTFVISCTNQKDKPNKKNAVPFVWQGANLYFLLVDRFNNGDISNDLNYNRTEVASTLRGFEGGDIKGITEKIKDGYFTNLGINAIWLTPVVEQIHGGTDEGTGFTYGYHGYWAKDWTQLDPNFGTSEDLHELVKTAHANGIRIVLDGVINHTGPVTESDGVWPNEWVRTEPQCTYKTYASTVTCTLVKNLPDVKTDSNESVDLPGHLVEKWKSEGRYEQEIRELDAFFERTGYPRVPKYYIIKWLSDYITEYGIDGYRVDTVKHVEEDVWKDFSEVCDYNFAQWKNHNPTKIMDDNDFYLLGEVYNYNISGKQIFDFGDKQVNYFDNGFQSLVNFEFKYDAKNNYESIFSKYSNILNTDLKSLGTLNYLTSHDDGSPFDKERNRAIESATKLLLSPGTSQVYYGDEFARSLIIEDTNGDATLRSMMEWNRYSINEEKQIILKHWQRLGRFRRDDPSIGAGVHKMISESPYVFQRTFSQLDYSDIVVIGLDLPKGQKELNLGNNFEEGTVLRDAYSGLFTTVEDGKVIIETAYSIVLLEKN